MNNIISLNMMPRNYTCNFGRNPGNSKEWGAGVSNIFYLCLFVAAFGLLVAIELFMGSGWIYSLIF